MSCIVPTCRRRDEKLIPFPADKQLAERWLNVIAIGCGCPVQIEENEIPAEICSLHFTISNCNINNSYEEPSRFIHRDETCRQIMTCRMCLIFYPSEDMVALEGTIGKQTIASILESIGILLTENHSMQMICLACVAQIEIFTYLYKKFTQAELIFREMLQKGQNSKMEVDLTQEDVVEEEELMETKLMVDGEEFTETVQPDHSTESLKQNRSQPKNPIATTQITSRIRPRKSSASLKIKLERTCYICETVRPDTDELMVHLMKTHTSDAGYRCDECSLDFPLLHAYNRHLSRHRESQLTHKCSVCTMRYSSICAVKRHENLMHGANHNVKPSQNIPREKVCEQCGKVYDVRRLKDHIQQVHKKESNPKCKICDKSFTTRGSLKRHLLSHTKLRPYSCDQCEKTFQRLLDYRQHKSIVHDGINPHVCSECNQEFKNYMQLYIHKKKIHQQKLPKYLQVSGTTNPTKYKTCKLCQFRFTKWSELSDHIQFEHADEEYPVIKCPDCPKTFILESQLSNHKMIHSGRYDCQECGASHPSKHMLQYHMEVKHPDGRVYSCSECPSTFTSQHQLNLHNVLHTKGKQFQCEFCKKCFLRRFQLMIHRRIHTGEKPFQCDGCSKRFSDDRSFCKHKKLCKALLALKAAESSCI